MSLDLSYWTKPLLTTPGRRVANVTSAPRSTLRSSETNNASRKCISCFLHKVQQWLFSTIPDVSDYVTSHVFPLQLSLISTSLHPNTKRVNWRWSVEGVTLPNSPFFKLHFIDSRRIICVTINFARPDNSLYRWRQSSQVSENFQ